MLMCLPRLLCSGGLSPSSDCLRPGAAAGSACQLSSAALTDLSMQSVTSKELSLKAEAADTVDDIDMPEIANTGTDIELNTGTDVNKSRTRLDVA